MPWPWIVAAAALPGKALLVGLCLWRLAGAMKSRTVRLGNADLKPFGIDRAAKSRALSALEGAGLIEVAREPSRFPTVTLPASADRRGGGAGTIPRVFACSHAEFGGFDDDRGNRSAVVNLLSRVG